MGEKLNYAIQCTDTVSGKKGSFGFNSEEYLSADRPLQFIARTPVFPGLVELFAWSKENSVDLESVPCDWGKK